MENSYGLRVPGSTHQNTPFNFVGYSMVGLIRISRVRTAKFRVALRGGTKEERSARYKDLVSIVDKFKRASNRLLREWLLWHEANGSANAIREWLDTPRQDRPKFTLQCVSKDNAARQREAIRRLYGDINGRCVDLMSQKIKRNLESKSRTVPSLKAWWSILLDNENVSSYVTDIPVPIDKANWKLCVEYDGNGRPTYLSKCNLGRYRVIGKNGKEKTVGEVYDFEINTQGKENKSLAWIIKTHIDEESRDVPDDKRTVVVGGSSVKFYSGKNQWYLLLSYTCYENVRPMDSSMSASLEAGDDVPFVLSLPDNRNKSGVYAKWIHSRGADGIGEVRSMISAQRIARMANYRHASGAAKGHGRKRAIKSWEGKLAQRWRQYQNNVNLKCAREITDELIRRGIGTLHYSLPTKTAAKTKFLARSGVREADRYGGWSWFEFGQKLKNACERAGIECKDASKIEEDASGG